MSSDPVEPQGFNRYAGSFPDIDEGNLAEERNINALPCEVQQAIEERKSGAQR